MSIACLRVCLSHRRIIIAFPLLSSNWFDYWLEKVGNLFEKVGNSFEKVHKDRVI